MATFTIGNFDGMSFADNGVTVQSLTAYGIGGALTMVPTRSGSPQPASAVAPIR